MADIEMAEEYLDRIDDTCYARDDKDLFLLKGIAMIAYQLEQINVNLNHIIQNMDVRKKGKES